MTKKEIRRIHIPTCWAEKTLLQNIPDDRRGSRRRTHSSQAGRSANILKVHAFRRHRTRRWTEDEQHDMSHALLLRLFLAPSFFTVHVALQYLALYSDNIGITYYLTRRLNEIDPRELRDVWGFIW